MFGVNYKFKVNEKKNVITLRPTLGSTIAFTALSALSWVPFVVILNLAAKNEKKTTYTEDHLPQN